MKAYSLFRLLFVLLFLCRVPTWASGLRGSYSMTGTAYAHGKVLRKVVLVFTVGQKQIVVRTTKTGAYWVQIPWETPCPNGTFSEGYYKLPVYERVFPRYFTVDWNDKTLGLKSRANLYIPQVILVTTPPKIIVPGLDENGNPKDVVQNLCFK